MDERPYQQVVFTSGLYVLSSPRPPLSNKNPGPFRPTEPSSGAMWEYSRQEPRPAVGPLKDRHRWGRVPSFLKIHLGPTPNGYLQLPSPQLGVRSRNCQVPGL